MNLIDKDTLLKAVAPTNIINGLGLEPVVAMQDVREVIEVLPTIDAIPISWLNQVKEHATEAGDVEMVDAIRCLIAEWKRREKTDHE